MISGIHRSKTLRNVKCKIFSLPNSTFLLLSSLRGITSNAVDNGNSYIESYLTNNCGLSSKSALSASKFLNFKTPDRPDSVLAFLKSHGFSNTQITTLICRRPSVLLADPEKTLLPKIQFFHSKGFEMPKIAQILSVCPDILHSSLRNQIIPGFDVIRNLLPSNEKALLAIKRYPRIMLNFQSYVLPNIKILQETGLPESSIAWLVRYHPATLKTRSARFAEIVEEAKGMGLNPLVLNFVVALHAIRGFSKSTWEKKIGIYKKWGWSKEEIIMAFGKHAWLMMYSEEKITAMMDFYINKMGLDSSYIAQCPLLISLSLERRVVPRCSVLQVLRSKRLIRPTSLFWPLKITEEAFLRKYVTPYKDEAPDLLKLYKQKLNLPK
ncbi:hypothetical protein JCGZ_21044 [Jatropha curcas]|uniref:Uncharacterized protein n=1 Tax=Jatropha curcas TaxID=180498 RepID=A0A067JPX0_JATCU|nr:transcription termination factor MTERF8, chloroplastic-like [Jatropha curcas]KDP26011.1 hypothetical protein JCGZ_21044 [Jatropha curcas]